MIFLVKNLFPTNWTSPIAQLVKNLLAMQETLVWFLGGEDPLEGKGYPLQYSWASLVALLVKNQPAMRENWVRSLGWENPLKEETATHSSILAWRIPWTEEPDVLQSPWGHKESDTTERLSCSLCIEDLLPWDIYQSSYHCSFISWVPFLNSILKYHITNTGLESKTKSLLNI